ncbi:S8 family serine peptidase [Nitrosospira sp. Is2]|uniref:S8 family serine peptidase n=1 Tax=Nitrosospira sp. Is2 TaxID=3080532 RepID=UPI00295508DC|nr:S8 family serine peptidase [Nitrosospira sp. Is2]WON74413.1 S8 family serine peptidase [Nitrosospira sp. Is2]
MNISEIKLRGNFRSAIVTCCLKKFRNAFPARSSTGAMILAVFAGLFSLGSMAGEPESRVPGAGRGGTWAEGRILVMPNAGLSEKELAKILDEHGGKARKIGQSDLYIVDLTAHGSERAIAARLAHHPHLKFAELDYLVEPDFVPNDPQYGNAWHLPKIGASSAWDRSQGSGVTIAILDSGVDGAHPDLSSRMVAGWNFYDNNSITSDVFGHGTKVAGTASAITNNAVGISGVAGQSKIMPVRVAGTTGSAYISTIAKGLTWAADNRARIANVSFNGVAGSASIQNASQYMKNKGGLVVVAAGNNGIDQNYTPTTTLIAVSATDGNDFKASWSSYGSFVAMSAPGAGILTTTWGGGYGWVSGTSFASPITAGVVALMMAANPGLPNTDIEKRLFSTAIDLGDRGRDPYFGYGRVSAAGAVQAVISVTPALDIQSPVISISSPYPDATVSGLVPVNVSATDNIEVSRVELRVNNNTVAIDNAAPFAFTWDSAGSPDGIASLIAYAYDAVGNVDASEPVAVNVANGPVTITKDTTAPTVKIINPVAGNVSGRVTITINASDNAGAAGITLYVYVDSAMVASGTGNTLSYAWNTRPKDVPGQLHTIRAVAKDRAGNTSSASVNVNVVK